MNKKLLLKYIQGETTSKEREEVIDWIESSPRNKFYFLNLKNLETFGQLTDKEAGDTEFNRFLSMAERSEDRPTRNIYKLISWIAVPAAVAAAVLLILNLSFSADKYERLKEQSIQIALADIPHEHLHSVYTEKGVKGHLWLPDSSEVWINSDSRLLYPSKFIGNTREIFLEGEAYFKVRKNTERPMMVNTSKGMTVKVLGTEFNVKAYKDDDFAEAALYKGNIEIECNAGKSSEKTINIKPGKKFIFSKKSAVITPCKEPQIESDWKYNQMIFDNTPLSNVIKRLERWYGIHITVVNDEITHYPITATFDRENILEILDIIRACSLVDYDIKGKEVRLFKRNLKK